MFQAINTPPSYNYIGALANNKINKLFIKDDYGKDNLTKSSYYIGINKNLDIADNTQRLIKKIIEDLNINKKDTIFAGSSKGGFAALYHGYIFGGGYILPGGPQVLLGDYLYKTDSSTVRHEIFKSIVGEFNAANKSWANLLIYDVLCNSAPPYPKTKIHIGMGEPHYRDHVLPFLNWAETLGIPYVQLDTKDYSTHEELARYYPLFLNDELKKLL